MTPLVIKLAMSIDAKKKKKKKTRPENTSQGL